MFRQVINILLLLFLMGLSFHLNSQDILNSDFEIWSTDGPYDIADSWNSSNDFTYQINNTISLIMSNDAYHGSSAAMVSTTLIGIAAQPYLGYLVTGIPNIDQMTGEVEFFSAGYPFSLKPMLLKGYYKFENTFCTYDSAVAVVILKKYNSMENISDTIGFGSVNLPQSAVFQEFSLLVDYLVTDEVPDSLVIAFLSSNTEPLEGGGELTVDFLSFDYLGIHNETNGRFKLYPNPSNDHVTIEFPEYNGILRINIYNMLGDLVKLNRAHSPSPKSVINLEDLHTGYYIVEVSDNQQVLFTEKIMVNKN